MKIRGTQWNTGRKYAVKYALAGVSAVGMSAACAYAGGPFDASFCLYAAHMKYASAGLKLLATIILGIYLLINRGTWTQALLHLTASALLFSASEIVNALTPASATCPP